jgi:hypothetical protein
MHTGLLFKREIEDELSCTGLDKPLVLQKVEAPRISRQLTHERYLKVAPDVVGGCNWIIFLACEVRLFCYKYHIYIIPEIL